MRIHILSDSPKQMTGFSVVGKNLAVELQKLGHEISMSGFQTTAGDDEDYKGIKILPIHVQYIDELGQYINNVQKSNAELCINIFNGDDAQQNIFAKTIRPTFWYCPVEGRNIPDIMSRDLLEVSQTGKIIAQCNWGKQEMLNTGVSSTTIYHGYDPEVFKKQSIVDSNDVGEKINVLKYEFGKWGLTNVNIRSLSVLYKKFVFGFVGANHGIRKRIERLLTAYSLFLKDNKYRKDRTLLVLRTMPISVTSPANLLKICADLEISSNVIFLYGDNNRLTDEAMNIIYNCFDVNVSASGSEGFGLSTLESMACGIPQIGPYCSSFIELIIDIKIEDDRGLLTDKGEWQMIQDGSFRFLVNEQNLADKMEILYSDKNLRESCGKNAEEWTKQYTWEKVTKQWDILIKSMTNNSK